MTVQIGGTTRRARALTVTGEQRRELWARLCERNRTLERVQQRAGRELPLVRLVVPAVNPQPGSVLTPDADPTARA